MSELIRAYLARLRAGGYAETTVTARAGILGRLESELQHGLTATADELTDWLGNPHWSRWTRYTYFEAVVSFYGWATTGEDAFLDYDPTRELIRPRTPSGEPRPATEEQLVAGMALGRPWRVAVVLAAFNGLRCAEICRLNRSDVTAGTVRVHRKGGKVQELPTHGAVWAEVQDLPAGRLLLSPRGRPFRPARLSGEMSRVLSAAVGVRLTLHQLRHRYATQTLLPRELGGAGADIHTVQDLLGHASVASTQIYTQVTDRQRRLAVAALPVPGAPSAGLSQAA
jgi:integrase